jgi:sucrose phosphorylase
MLGTGNDYQRLEHSGHNRHINRHQWDYDELTRLLDDGENRHRLLLDGIKRVIALRRRQPAFHPNATQFTLHLGDRVFAFWRQSLDRRQSIFCLNNLSDQSQQLALSDINLVGMDSWHDLISAQPLAAQDTALTLEPYQCIWLTNG